jgi:hypothetical protein
MELRCIVKNVEPLRVEAQKLLMKEKSEKVNNPK